MPDERHAQTDDPLLRYWDDLTRGTLNSTSALDPLVTGVIQRFHALDDAPAPDPAFVTRLREEIMDITPHANPFSLNSRAPLADRRTATGGFTWPTLPSTPSRRRWALAQLATAALLIITLGTAYFAFVARPHNGVAPSVTGLSTPTAATPGVPMFRGNAARTGEVSGPGPEGTPEVRWRFTTGAGGRSTPAVADGILYVGGADDNLYALDATTGEERWRFPLGADGLSSPAVVDGVVYTGAGAVVGGDGALYAVEAASGAERWRFATDGGIVSSPAVVDSVVYVGSNDHFLYAVDAATGNEVWKFETGDAVQSSPAVVDGTVFVGSWDGFLYAVDAATGEERWRFQADNQIWATPAVTDGAVFFGTDGPTFYAVDAATGQERWQFANAGWRAEAGPTPAAPAVAGGSVYVAGGENLYALDTATGQERWTWIYKRFMELLSPAVANGVIYMGEWNTNVNNTGAGELFAVDATSGQQLWHVTVGQTTWAAPVVADGMVFITTDDGELVAVGAASGGEATPPP